jgi:ribosomal protein L11 methyltransferase
MWQQLSVATDQALADTVADRFSDHGALSVSLEDEGDQPLLEPGPGETPLWNDTRVIALFEDGVDLDGIRADLSRRFDRLGSWRVEVIQDQVWERAWLEHFHPMRFGRRLWIVPTGYAAPEQPDAIRVSLDPGLAFGTGTHPTTALCLEWLDSLTLTGQTVIDYGCGSGILAVAALLAGAGNAIGVDIDPQALAATKDNARKNRVAADLRICHPKHLPEFRADGLVANILAGPLIELAETLSRHVRPGGWLALSGILREQADGVRQAYEPWFAMEPPVFREKWTRLNGTRRPD